MKKAIPLLFLLLANMVMLFHVVIPHHYHHDKSTVCFFTVHCVDCEVTREHSHDFDCRQHDDDGEMEECPFKDIYRRPGIQKLFVSLSLNDGIHDPMTLPINPTDKPAGLESLSFISKSYSLPCYTNHISDSSGLRAPPALI